jgi:2-polyprenyl-6-methoxyphenol hydroxylase-like FAD-dependent oxidoreductase
VVLDARYVVGADGLTSGIARSVGAPFTERRSGDGSAQYAYFDGIPWDGIELYAAEGALAGVFPTHDDAACVWITSRSADARAARRTAASREDAFAARLARHAPSLAARLRRARLASPVTGMFRMPNHVRRPYGPGWALVGDAGYHRDAVTGHGLSDAYRDAELLAVALDRALRGSQGADGDAALADYERARNGALREVFELTCALAGYPAVPRFVELQKQLSRALDAEATELVLRPVPGERPLVPA